LGATLLNTLEVTLEWAKNHDLERIAPVVKLLETTYQKGVKLCKKAFEAMSNRIDRTRHCQNTM